MANKKCVTNYEFGKNVELPDNTHSFQYIKLKLSINSSSVVQKLNFKYKINNIASCGISTNSSEGLQDEIGILHLYYFQRN